MNRLKIAYIDHSFRKFSKSTNFLIEYFSTIAAVERFEFQPFEKDTILNLINSDYDGYVVVQADPYVPVLLSHGKNVISVPMYDGSGEIGPLNWAAQRGALIINFCYYIHKVCRLEHCESLYVQYFPPIREPANVESENQFNTLKVFFWERVPSQGLNVAWLSKLLKSQKLRIESLHIHIAPDPRQCSSIVGHDNSEIAANISQRLFPDTRVTTSRWIDDKSQLDNILELCNTYVCSRQSEGIGLGALEAMERGMYVIGVNKPTLNEYIDNGKNGTLVSLNGTLPNLGSAKLATMAHKAKRDVVEGREVFLKRLEAIKPKIAENLRRKAKPSKRPVTANEAVELSRAFVTDQQAYKNILKYRYINSATKSNKTPSLARQLDWLASAMEYHAQRIPPYRPVARRLTVALARRTANLIKINKVGENI